MTWQRLVWSQRGGDWRGHGMARLAWAWWILMGLFDFLLLIFVFWVWMGWILDSYGLVFWIPMGFGLDLDWLVGLAWWAVGCLVVFAMGLLGFGWVLFLFFLFFSLFFFLGFWFWWAVVVWWAWWWHSGA